MSARDIESGALKLLKSVCSNALSIRELFKRLEASRTTASRYVTILEAEGKVVCIWV